MRPKPLSQLLHSVKEQTLYPDEILIIDGSTNDETEQILANNSFLNLNYFLVPKEQRGLTKQRNYGIARVGFDNSIHYCWAWHRSNPFYRSIQFPRL